MGKLKGRGLPSRLGAARPSGRLSLDREVSVASGEPAWRGWYKTARWQKLRRKVLVRDKYTCQATGAKLIGRYPAENSAVVDHIVPHRGNPDLFWDGGNLQAMSKVYHDRHKQKIEYDGQVHRRGGGSKVQSRSEC